MGLQIQMLLYTSDYVAMYVANHEAFLSQNFHVYGTIIFPYTVNVNVNFNSIVYKCVLL